MIESFAIFIIEFKYILRILPLLQRKYHDLIQARYKNE